MTKKTKRSETTKRRHELYELHCVYMIGNKYASEIQSSLVQILTMSEKQIKIFKS